MSQLEYQTTSHVMPFRSQRAGLVAFGIIFILLGLLGLVPLIALCLDIMQGSSDIHEVVKPLVIVAILTGFAFHLGIDCIRTRRWVQPVGSVAGLLGLVAGLWIAAPWVWDIVHDCASFGNVRPILLPLALFPTIFVALPASTWLFFRRKAVNQTVQYRDPSPSWTDGFPSRLVAVILLQLTMAVDAAIGIVGLNDSFNQSQPTLEVLAPTFAILQIVSAALLMYRVRVGWWLALATAPLQTMQWALQLIRNESGHFLFIVPWRLRELLARPIIGLSVWGGFVLIWYILLISSHNAWRASPSPIAAGQEIE